MMLEKFFLMGGGDRKPRKLSDTKVQLLNESENTSMSTNGNSSSSFLNGNKKYKTSLNAEENEDTFDALDKTEDATPDEMIKKY
jgi:hypothetical protein